MKSAEVLARRLLENVGRLRLLGVVARHGSLSRAAVSLNLSQSALSHALKSLETVIDAPLFVRKSRGVELTVAGRIVAALGTNLEQSVANMAARLVEGESAPRSIRVGTHETLAVHVWPAILERIVAESDRVRISLISGRIDELVDGLLHGGLDVLVAVSPTHHHKLDIRPLYAGSLQFFAPLSGPIALASTLSQLRKFPLLTDIGAHCRQGLSIPEALFENGLPQEGPFEVTSFEAAIQLAASGLGVAVIPDRNAARAVAEGRLVKLAIRGLRRPALLQYSICVTVRAGTESTHEIDQMVTWLRT